MSRSFSRKRKRGAEEAQARPQRIGFFGRIARRLEKTAWGAPVVGHMRRHPRIYRFWHIGLYSRIAAWLETKEWGRSIVAHIRKHLVIYRPAEAILTAVLLALFIRAYVIEIYRIPSGSMQPTLLGPNEMLNRPGDRVLVRKRVPLLSFLGWYSRPDRGDVVVFDVPEKIRDPKKPVYIKRIVGLPGDLVEIRNERLYVNGEEVLTPPFFNGWRYSSNLTWPGADPKRFEPIKVPEGHVLVFGDNTDNSYDGRFWGPVPIRNIRGKAILVVWPLSRMMTEIP